MSPRQPVEADHFRHVPYDERASILSFTFNRVNFQFLLVNVLTSWYLDCVEYFSRFAFYRLVYTPAHISSRTACAISPAVRTIHGSGQSSDSQALIQSRDITLARSPPKVYKPGTRLTLTLPEHNGTLKVEILKAFNPFTNSVALLVKPAPSVLRLPPRVVLKLADRRIEEDWDLDGERDYQERIRSHIETFGAIKSLRRPDEVPPAWRYMLEYWEYRERSHSQERQAYQCLSEAQEMGLVPRFFGSARLMMNERACHPSLTHIDGLLVEYIDGRTMASYKPGIDLSPKEAEAISQRVLQLGRDLRRYGVSHNDINVHNVIIRSRNSHPVLIDWGKADTSLANAPLARRWTDHSMWQDFHRDVRWLLRHGGDGDTLVAGGVWHRYRTPVSDVEQCREAQDAGWGVINSGISGLSDQERERFYEEDESVDSGKGLRWRVRRGVRTRLADDPVPDE